MWILSIADVLKLWLGVKFGGGTIDGLASIEVGCGTADVFELWLGIKSGGGTTIDGLAMVVSLLGFSTGILFEALVQYLALFLSPDCLHCRHRGYCRFKRKLHA